MHHVRPVPVFVSLLVGLLLLPAGMAQPSTAPPKPLAFEPASIKPLGSPVSGVPDGTGRTIARKEPGVGGNTEHPGRIHYQEGLRSLLMKAYDLGYFQILGAALAQQAVRRRRHHAARND